MTRVDPVMEVHADTCPLCGCDEQREVLVTSSGRLVRCRACGLVRNPNYPSISPCKRYSEDYFAGRVYPDYLAGEQQWRHEARLRVEFMRALGFNAPVLEIGCAAGYFLDELRRLGVPACGIDVSNYAASHARGVLGLDVTVADVAVVELPTGTQGSVCLWHSLEHMVRPLETLCKCYTWLADGGRLFAEVPNFGSFARRRLGAAWQQLVLEEHAVQFEPPTFKALLESAGFRVLSMTTVPPRIYQRRARDDADLVAVRDSPMTVHPALARPLQRTMGLASRLAYKLDPQSESLMRVVATKR